MVVAVLVLLLLRLQLGTFGRLVVVQHTPHRPNVTFLVHCVS